MINRVEKLSLLSEMIAFARIDKTLKEIEYNFLLGVAKQLEISRDDCFKNYLKQLKKVRVQSIVSNIRNVD